ncbi:hypothetical protein GFL72_17115 [Rhizobium leguminosarum bv. viciae]|uniref:TniQ family protein n=1 Tax=Rhizobium leguminosarum TaxID=384 RepID=UPI00144261AF|nr:TniQ family protein [Rhizobium leguminosarum]NKK36345.1 hypothetical protein [Rhizobium leguminosarum bv. viciae]
MSALFDVPLFEHEPLTSWFARLARANSAPNSRVLFRYLGIDRAAFLRGDRDEIARVAGQVGRSEDELFARAVITNDNASVTVAGATFGKRMVVGPRRLRFCPHCILSDDQDEGLMHGARRRLRPHWMFLSVQTCPVHLTQIVEAEHVGLQRHPYDLISQLEVVAESMPELILESVPRQMTAFERFVCDRLEGRRNHGDFLDTVTPAVGITACELLGTAYVYGRDTAFAGLSNEAMVEARNTAFDFIVRGSHGFTELLDYIRSNGRASYAGGQALYGKLYSALLINFKEPEYGVLRERIRSHTLKTVRVINGSEFFGKVTDSEWTTVSALVDATGSSDQTLRRLLVEMGHLDSVRQKDGEQTIPVAVVENALGKLRDMIDLEEVAAILGINRMHAWYLLKGGLIEPVVKRDGGSERSYRLQNRYSKTAVLRLRDCIMKNTITPCSKALVPISKAVKLANTSYVGILEAVIEGRFKRCGRAEDEGIAGLRFDPAEIESLYWKAPGSALDRAEVRKRMLLTSKAFTYLVSEGYLRAERIHLHQSRAPVWIVAESDFEDFSSKYVTFALIAQQTRCSTRGLGRRRQDRGIPLAFPEDKVDQCIVERIYLPI